MTLENAEAMLTAEQVVRLRELGKEWGEQEADLWRDQNPGRSLPEWTMGAYCGDLEEYGGLRDEADLVVDCAARDAWTTEEQRPGPERIIAMTNRWHVWVWDGARRWLGDVQVRSGRGAIRAARRSRTYWPAAYAEYVPLPPVGRRGEQMSMDNLHQPADLTALAKLHFGDRVGDFFGGRRSATGILAGCH